MRAHQRHVLLARVSAKVEQVSSWAYFRLICARHLQSFRPSVQRLCIWFNDDIWSIISVVLVGDKSDSEQVYSTNLWPGQMEAPLRMRIKIPRRRAASQRRKAAAAAEALTTTFQSMCVQPASVKLVASRACTHKASKSQAAPRNQWPSINVRAEQSSQLFTFSQLLSSVLLLLLLLASVN